MNIQRNEYEQDLAIKFEEDLITAYALTPGIAKKSNDLLYNRDYSFMCSVSVKNDIESFFGKSDCFVRGKNNKANLFAFLFKDQNIICTCEGESVGTGWYWVKPEENGSRYGNPMLLSCDKEVKDFWPDFCISLKEMIENKSKIKNQFKPK